MIKINKEYLLKNLNNIISKDRNYGKQNIGNNQKIVISTYIPNISNISDYLKIFITIDNIARIYSNLGYITSKEVLILDNDISNLSIIQKQLDKYRITINNYESLDGLYQKGIVDEVLLKFQYTKNCHIKDNALYIKLNNNEEAELTNNKGDYSDLLYLTSYNYNSIIDNKNLILVLPSNYYNINVINKVLSIINDKKIIIKEVNIIRNNYNANINYIRYILSKQTNSEDLYELIEDVVGRINNILSKNKLKIINKYNELDDELSYNILYKIYEFPNIVMLAKESTISNTIINYLEKLTILLNSYINKNNNYTEEKLSLLYASKIVLNNTLELVGIIH